MTWQLTWLLPLVGHLLGGLLSLHKILRIDLVIVRNRENLQQLLISCRDINFTFLLHRVMTVVLTELASLKSLRIRLLLDLTHCSSDLLKIRLIYDRSLPFQFHRILWIIVLTPYWNLAVHHFTALHFLQNQELLRCPIKENIFNQ